jgi:hypothetical protein
MIGCATITGCNKPVDRIESIDFLKGLAIIAVIILHSFTSYGMFDIILFQAVPVFLILLGINGAMSLDKHGFVIGDYMRTKLYRFILSLVPVGIVVTSIALLYNLTFWDKYGGSPLWVLLGQMPVTGPGNYFIALIIQSIVVIPILWWIAKKNPNVMIVGSFVISTGFELINFLYPVDANLYQLSIFRWIFAIAIGVAVVNPIITKNLSINWVVGIYASSVITIFLWLSQTPYVYALQSVFTYLFACGIIIAVVFIGVSWKPINVIGKLSYHIFLVQMTFFILFNFGVIINLSIIVTMGVLFYFIDSKTSEVVASVTNKGGISC